jgi:hypothetical protein
MHKDLLKDVYKFFYNENNFTEHFKDYPDIISLRKKINEDDYFSLNDFNSETFVKH